jgi:uncharacterized protein (TIGR03435 family)
VEFDFIRSYDLNTPLDTGQMRPQWRKHGIEMLLVRGWASFASLAVIAIGWAMATERIAFAQAAPTFEVTPAGAVGNHDRSRRLRTPQKIAFQATRVGDIMAFAYELPLDRIERRPQWMYDDVYDVAVTTAAPANLPEQKLLLQKLLEERFGLAVHRVSNESPVYFLVPLGAKVYFTETKEAEAVDIFRFCISQPRPLLQTGDPRPIGNVCTARHVSMGDLADWLYSQVRLPVIDKTGLMGFYDLEITGLPMRGGAEGTIRAVRDALGLNLESHRGMAESLIIDHAERPSGN